ncbi:Alpha/Beta hydrolase protein [Biscogniauxia marginata]|nr:Alpha/Beta hydrolase protein [Biscogniauxia marginata]
MVQVVEGAFEVDGVSLFTKTWLPDEPPKAKMVMFHGFSDHIDRYYDFFPSLARRGIAVYGLDQRGWGRSAPNHADKGRTGPTSRVLADMAVFIQHALAAPPRQDVPLFVLGHSMGGGQVLTLASTPEYRADVVSRVRGWILESPFLGFAPELQPSALTIASGRLASHVVPLFKLHRPVPPTDLTRDPEVRRSIAADPLLHNYGTLEGLAGMLDRTAALASGAIQPDGRAMRSLLLAHGSADKVTSFDKAKDWFEGIGRPAVGDDATFRPYEGMYHQMHADYGKEDFYRDVGDWILARCDGGEDAAAYAPAPESKL